MGLLIQLTTVGSPRTIQHAEQEADRNTLQLVVKGRHLSGQPAPDIALIVSNIDGENSSKIAGFIEPLGNTGPLSGTR